MQLLAASQKLGKRALETVTYLNTDFNKDCEPAAGTSSSEIGCVAPLVTILERTTSPLTPLDPQCPARTSWSIGGKSVAFSDGLVSGNTENENVTMKSVVTDLGYTYHGSSNVVATAKAIQFVTACTTVNDGNYTAPTVASDKVQFPPMLQTANIQKIFSSLMPVLIKLPKLPTGKVSASQYFIWLDNNAHKYPHETFEAKQNKSIIELQLSGTNAFTAAVLTVYCSSLKRKLKITLKEGKLVFSYPKAILKLPTVLHSMRIADYKSPANATLLMSATRSQRGTDANTRGETHKSFYTGVHLSDKYVQDVLVYKNVFAPALKVVGKLWAKEDGRKINLQIVADKGKLAHILALAKLKLDKSATIASLSKNAEFDITVLYDIAKSQTTLSKACDQVDVKYAPTSRLEKDQPVLYWFDRSVEFSHKTHAGDKFSTYILAVADEFGMKDLAGAPVMLANVPAIDMYGGGYEPGATPHNLRAFYVSNAELCTINTKDKLADWCSVSAILNWHRTCSFLTSDTLETSLVAAAGVSDFASTLVRPLAGTLVPSFRKALDDLESAISDYVEVEGSVIEADDDENIEEGVEESLEEAASDDEGDAPDLEPKAVKKIAFANDDE